MKQLVLEYKGTGEHGTIMPAGNGVGLGTRVGHAICTGPRFSPIGRYPRETDGGLPPAKLGKTRIHVGLYSHIDLTTARAPSHTKPVYQWDCE